MLHNHLFNAPQQNQIFPVYNTGILVSQTLARPQCRLLKSLTHFTPSACFSVSTWGSFPRGTASVEQSLSLIFIYWNAKNECSCNSIPPLCLTLLYSILHIRSPPTPLPFINSTPWALGGPCATIFNVLWNEVIALSLAISRTLQNVSSHLRSGVFFL